MHIRSTLDPISLHEVPDPEHHPCLYEGDGVNGVEVYFENEENKQIYMDMDKELGQKKVLASDDSDDYVAEG